MYDRLFVFMCAYHYKNSPYCVISSTFMLTNCPHVAPIHHLLVQLFVQLADLLLIFLPLLLGNVNHNGGCNGAGAAGAAGAADVKNWLFSFWSDEGNFLQSSTLPKRNIILN